MRLFSRPGISRICSATSLMELVFMSMAASRLLRTFLNSDDSCNRLMISVEFMLRLLIPILCYFGVVLFRCYVIPGVIRCGCGRPSYSAFQKCALAPAANGCRRCRGTHH